MLHYKLLGIIKSLFMYFKDSKINNLEQRISLTPNIQIKSPPLKVKNHLSKFHLKWTVNEPENAVLRKLREPKKLVAPSAQK